MSQPDLQSPLEKNTGSPSPSEPVFLLVGRLRAAHGVKGEIGMEVLTDFPERLKAGSMVFVGEKYRQMQITAIRWKNVVMLLTFAGITDRDQAAFLRNLNVYVQAEHLPKLPKGEYYHHELIGLRVVEESGNELGRLDEIIETGANDVYIVKPESGTELLLPAIESVILAVDLVKGEMVVRPPDWE
jgi:16S rRNA processing protein RimM